MQDKERITRMIMHIEKILSYCDNHTYDTFCADSMLVEACVFNLSQLGELCHGISNEFSIQHPEIPWNEMYGLRNRIVHNYDGVNLRLVWEIIADDLSGLLPVLQNIIKKEA